MKKRTKKNRGGQYGRTDGLDPITGNPPITEEDERLIRMAALRNWQKLRSKTKRASIDAKYLDEPLDKILLAQGTKYNPLLDKVGGKHKKHRKSRKSRKSRK